jgi:hypothetical protein
MTAPPGGGFDQSFEKASTSFEDRSRPTWPELQSKLRDAICTDGQGSMEGSQDTQMRLFDTELEGDR